MQQDMMLDQEQPDIEKILSFVQAGQADGIPPEQILDETELAIYDQHMAELKPDLTEHYANLAPALDSSTLGRLAQDIVQWVEWDDETRELWSKRESDGIKALGVTDQVAGGAKFEGASTVVHPLLSEAITQFHARAMAEMWPPEGPVKSMVLGEKTQERLAQAQRVEDYMNYQYTEDMPGAFEEEDALLFRLPLSGSVFKKVYYDPLIKKVCSRMIEPADFIVPFSATDLETAPRFTHRYRENHNTVLKKIASGYYIKDRAFTSATNETTDYPAVKEAIDRAEGRERVQVDGDDRHTMLEINIDLDLEGFEDIGEDGEPTDIALPYIVWVDRDNHSVLRIQRNWSPDDPDKRRRIDVSHYRFMPGLGFYGYGLLHLIGGLANSATGALRALLDSAAFANLQGGFRTRDSRIKGGLQSPGPGEWIEVDSSYEELAKAFFRLPYEEPSDVMFKLLGYMDEKAAAFIGGDVMTGDANPNAPVGTTLALIEQGGKSFSAVHRRLHVAHRNEFRILARLNSEYLPEGGYPYYSGAGDRMIMPQDFDERIDIIPVSDPSIISNTQRIVQAQAVLDLATKYPDKVNISVALRMMLEAMRIPNYEELLQPDPATQQTQAQAAEVALQLQKAQIEKIDAEKTESVIRGMFSAIQAGNMVATNPSIAAIADSIFKSAGGKDYDAGNLIDLNPYAIPQPMPQNTHPDFPANPNPVEPTPEQPPTSVPISPGMGAKHGIETMRNEMLQ